MILFTYIFGYVTLAIELIFFHVPSVANTQNFFKENFNYGKSQSQLINNIYSWPKHKKILILAVPLVLINLYFLVPFFYFSTFLYSKMFVLFQPNEWLNYMGGICVILGRMLTFGSMLHLRKENKQVKNSFKLHTSGIFKHTRNPGLDGMFLFFTGYALIFPSIFMLLGFVFYYFYMQFRVEIEEEFLKQLFKEEYIAYSHKTKRFLLF